MPRQGHNNFEKPPSVTFSFHQKQFDKSGELFDDRGQSVYKFRDVGEDHTFGFVKSYPLEIYHSRSNRLACTIDWHSSPKKTTVKGLPGQSHEINFFQGLMNDELRWNMPDGSQFEWDGIWGYGFALLDYRIQQPYSLSPAVAARYQPRPSKNEYTTLEVHRDALSVPGFLDYLVASVLWLEMNLEAMRTKKDAAAAFSASAKLGKQLGNTFGGDGGGDAGGGGDGGGGGGFS